jgi:hypothetical protein
MLKFVLNVIWFQCLISTGIACTLKQCGPTYLYKSFQGSEYPEEDVLSEDPQEEVDVSENSHDEEEVIDFPQEEDEVSESNLRKK